MLGVVDDLLVDRAFIEQRRDSALELASVNDVSPAAPHNVANALAAAGLARSYGVPATAVRQGLRAVKVGPHKIQTVLERDGVSWIDDSKATNPHAAGASLVAFEHVVWVAGGLLKGADVDALVQSVADRLRGVVLIGADREQIAQALARHAPDVPVVDLPDTDTGVMDLVVAHAGDLAQPGDVVLLAPAAASMDMFANYGVRGDSFAQAVHRYASRHPGPSA
jgi:UDP-N-acetylmuramoylalanine--D-glutamate ligase